eukprot:SAG11_NODE_26324_length_346_cov_3.234818_2_plen_51_part_01
MWPNLQWKTYTTKSVHKLEKKCTQTAETLGNRALDKKQRMKRTHPTKMLEM